LVCLLWWGNCIAGSTVLKRQEVMRIASSQVGIRERSGNNDGDAVEQYLHVTGLNKGYAWCAAFVAWVHVHANVTTPLSAYCPDWFNRNVVFRQNQKTPEPFVSKPGQVFGLYFESKHRVAHVGLITGETRFNYTTIEGNTNEAGSREGDGVYRKIRSKKSIYIISDYIK